MSTPISVAVPPPPADIPRPDYWPTHLDLPCDDGAIVHNFQEHPQSMLLSDTLAPVLARLHPDGRYCIGQDCGIYYQRLPAARAVAPDWFYVPDAPPRTDTPYRRSYVLWDEASAPYLILEFVSGDGSEERDRTPEVGKFWIYERRIRPAYYGIYEVDPGRIEMYRLVEDHFEQAAPDDRGHYFLPRLGVALGIWTGHYLNDTQPWMRWFDAAGQPLPTGHERAEYERQRAEQEYRRAELERQRAEQERQRAEQEHQRAEQEHQRAALLAAKLRELGVNPDQL